MLDVAIRKPDGSTAVDWQHVGVRTAPPLPVAPGAARRCCPTACAAAARSASAARCRCCSPCSGPRLGRRRLVRAGRLPAHQRRGGARVRRRPRPAGARPGPRVRGGRRRWARCSTPSTSWPRRPPPADAACRPATSAGSPPGPAARTRCSSPTSAEAAWPGADVRLHARDGAWSGIGDGTGRLRARQVEVDGGRPRPGRPAPLDQPLAAGRRRRGAASVRSPPSSSWPAEPSVLASRLGWSRRNQPPGERTRRDTP